MANAPIVQVLRLAGEADVKAFDAVVQSLGKVDQSAKTSTTQLGAFGGATQKAGAEAETASGKHARDAESITKEGTAAHGATAQMTAHEAAVKKAGETAATAAEHHTKLGGAVENLKGAVGAMIGPLGAMTAGIGAAFALEKSVEAAENLGSTVNRMNREFGQSSVQSSQLAAALQLSGTNTEGAEKGMLRFQKALAGVTEFEDGTALPVGKSFAQIMLDLGIKTKDAHGNILSMHDLLPQVSAAFQNMKDPTEKSAVAMNLFGRGGNEMLPFLAKGPAGIEEMYKKAGQLGLVLDDKTTKAMKENAQQTRDMHAAMQGLQVQVGLVLLPVLDNAAKLATTLAIAFNTHVVPAIKTAAEFVSKLVEGGFDRLSDIWGKVTEAFKKGGLGEAVKTAFGELLGLEGDVITTIGKFFIDVFRKINWPQVMRTVVSVGPTLLTALLSGGVDAIQAVGRAIGDLFRKVDWHALWQGYVDILKGMWDGFVDVIKSGVNLDKKIGSLIADAVGAINWQDVWSKIEDLAGKVWGGLRDALGAAEGLGQKVGDAISTALGSIDWAAVWKKVDDLAGKVWGALGDALNVAEKATAAVSTAFKSVDWQQVWKEATDDGNKVWDAFGEVVAKTGRGTTAIAKALGDFNTWGIGQALATAIDTINSGIDKLASTLEGLVGKGSPAAALIKDISESTKTLVKDLVPTREDIDAVRDAFAQVLDKLQPLLQQWGQVASLLKDKFEPALRLLADAAKIYFGVQAAILAVSWDVFLHVFDALGLKQGIVMAMKDALHLVGDVLQTLLDVGKGFADLLQGHWSDAWKDAITVAKDLTDAILTFFKLAIDPLLPLLNNIWTEVKKIWTGIKDDTVQVLTDLNTWLEQKAGDIFHAVIKGVEDAWAWFTNNLGKIKDDVTHGIWEIWDWVDKNFAEPLEKALEKPFKGFAGAIRGILNAATTPFNDFLGFIDKFLGKLYDAVNWIGDKLGLGQNKIFSGAPTPIGTIPGIGGGGGGGGDLAALAGGSPNWRGGVALVGEQGPEIVNLPAGAQVIPAGPTAFLRGTGMVGLAGGVGDWIGDVGSIFSGAADDVAGFVREWSAKGAAALLDRALSTVGFDAGLAGPFAEAGKAVVSKGKDVVVGILGQILSGALKAVGAGTGGGQPANLPGSATDWLKQAIQIVGVNEADWLPGLQLIASFESGGDPNAVNPVAVANGEHATGLMQTIPSTFGTYQLPGHGNILNPVDNAIAAIRYIQARYGGPNNPKLVASEQAHIGYAGGGGVPTTGLAWVGEAGPELVTLPGYQDGTDGGGTDFIKLIAQYGSAEKAAAAAAKASTTEAKHAAAEAAKEARDDARQAAQDAAALKQAWLDSLSTIRTAEKDATALAKQEADLTTDYVSQKHKELTADIVAEEKKQADALIAGVREAQSAAKDSYAVLLKDAQDLQDAYYNNASKEQITALQDKLKVDKQSADSDKQNAEDAYNTWHTAHQQALADSDQFTADMKKLADQRTADIKAGADDQRAAHKTALDFMTNDTLGWAQQDVAAWTDSNEKIKAIEQQLTGDLSAEDRTRLEGELKTQQEVRADREQTAKDGIAAEQAYVAAVKSAHAAIISGEQTVFDLRHQLQHLTNEERTAGLGGWLNAEIKASQQIIDLQKQIAQTTDETTRIYLQRQIDALDESISGYKLMEHETQVAAQDAATAAQAAQDAWQKSMDALNAWRAQSAAEAAKPPNYAGAAMSPLGPAAAAGGGTIDLNPPGSKVPGFVTPAGGGPGVPLTNYAGSAYGAIQVYFMGRDLGLFNASRGSVGNQKDIFAAALKVGYEVNPRPSDATLVRQAAAGLAAQYGPISYDNLMSGNFQSGTPGWLSAFSSLAARGVRAGSGAFAGFGGSSPRLAVAGAGGGDAYHFHDGSIRIDAKDLADIHTARDFFSRVKQVARATGRFR